MSYLLYTFALLVLSYLCFVFFSEQVNPFLRPPNPSDRKKWKHARYMGLASLLGMSVTLILFLTIDESLILSIAIGLASSLALAATFSARKISEYFWGQ